MHSLEIQEKLLGAKQIPADVMEHIYNIKDMEDGIIDTIMK